jgi:hypothetical protein
MIKRDPARMMMQYVRGDSAVEEVLVDKPEFAIDRRCCTAQEGPTEKEIQELLHFGQIWEQMHTPETGLKSKHLLPRAIAPFGL